MIRTLAFLALSVVRFDRVRQERSPVMRKLILVLLAVLIAFPCLAEPNWKTASKPGIITAGTTNVSCASSASMLKSFGWTKGNVVGLKAWAKGPFRIQMWMGGSGSTVWTPVDTVAVTRGTIGNFAVEFPCYDTFWCELDSFKIKPASSDTVRYVLFKD